MDEQGEIEPRGHDFENGRSPEWLTRIVGHDYPNYALPIECIAKNMLGAFPMIGDILNDSCFYLSAGADASPIIAFSEFIHSFVYCDDDWGRHFEHIEKLKTRLRERNFIEIQKLNVGREVLGVRPFHQLSNGQTEYHVDYSDRPGRRNQFDNAYEIYSGCFENRNYNSESLKYFNAEFSVWEHAGRLCSLLYVCLNNRYVWSDIYERNHVLPLMVSNICNEEFESTFEHILLRRPQFVFGHLYPDENMDAEATNDYDVVGMFKYLGDYCPGGDELPAYKLRR